MAGRPFVAFLVLTLLTLIQNSNCASSQAVTLTLDQILSNYDKRIRPTYNGNATVIKVDLKLMAITSVSDRDFEFSADLRLRQRWTDARLLYNSADVGDAIVVRGAEELIWAPDTTFVNRIGGSDGDTVHLEIARSGEITKDERISASFLCEFDLQYYPFDSQTCQIVIESLGFTDSHLDYEWAEGQGTEFTAELAEFSAALTGVTKKTEDNRARLVAELDLSRRPGRAVLSVFVPCTAVVMLSWALFWLDSKQAATRALIGVILLCLLTLILVSKPVEESPASGYATSKDVYAGICGIFLLLAIAECVVVDFLQRREDEVVNNVFEEEKKFQCSKLRRADNVDRISRIAFPVFFFVLSIFFWPIVAA